MANLPAVITVIRSLRRGLACALAAFACACVSPGDGPRPSEPAPGKQTDSPLRGTHWKLVRLGETPVETAAKQREPHLILASSEPRVSGSGGCNRVAGGFELDGDKLRFSRMVSTRMACVAGMEQEQRFLQSIEKVERYRIKGSDLEMLDAGGAVVARFQAVTIR